MNEALASRTADQATLHADAAAALALWERHAPAPTARARGALERLLGRACGAHAWSGSRLTGDGYPIELVFAFGSDRVRYTVDPIVNGCGAGDALRESLAFAGQLPAATAEALAWLRRAHAVAELRYGAWIGGAHDASEDRLKLYIEIPPGPQKSRGAASHPPAGPAVDTLAADRRRPLLGPAATVRMIGVEVTTGRMETYWRTRRLETHDLARALAARGLRHRAAELIEFVEREYGHPIDGQVPGSPAGLSESVGPGDAAAVTLFVFARTLWGGDSRIRERLQALTRGTAASDAYHEITAPLAQRGVYQTYHGLLGITVAADDALRLSVGVRPPPV